MTNHRNKRGQYDSLLLKLERFTALAVLLAMVYYHVHQATNAKQSELESLQYNYIMLINKADALDRQNIQLQLHPDLSAYEDELAQRELDLAFKNKARVALATAYSCVGITSDQELLMNCPSKLNPKNPNGRTSSGTTPTVNRTVACDPSLLGQTINIEGIGERICEDTGSAIKGNRIDVYVGNIKQAYQWGAQMVKYVVVDK